MKKIVVFLFVFALLAGWAFAAEKTEVTLNKNLKAQIEKAKTMRVASSNTGLLLHTLGVGPDMGLQLVRSISDDRSLTHYRYNVTFKNVPVWGEQIIISEDSDRNIARLHGFVVTGIEIDITDVEPAITSEDALDLVKSTHKVTEEREIVFYENESSNLVIYIHEGKAVLCYAVSFFADVEVGGKPTRPTYFIDAKTKEVVYHFEALTFEGTEAVGTGPGGNTKTGKYYYGQQYPAFEVAFSNGSSTMNTTNVKTVNLNHSTSGSTAYTYTGTENTVKEINGAYSPLNDAHYFGGVLFNMYKDWYATSPLTQQLMLRVHYSKSYENAFWNGSSMTFGDGATRFYPLVSLDVVAHEASHGFTEQNSGLVYSKQSGGINESFSDMAGEAAEFYMSKTNDFMVGAQIFKSTGALRYMADPEKDGKSIGSATKYNDSMDVHYSSGVFNKAFAILAAKPGWNTKMAFDVFTKANQKYWTANATFVSAAKGVMSAAGDYGYNLEDVKAAFAAVDVAATLEE